MDADGRDPRHAEAPTGQVPPRDEKGHRIASDQDREWSRRRDVLVSLGLAPSRPSAWPQWVVGEQQAQWLAPEHPRSAPPRGRAALPADGGSTVGTDRDRAAGASRGPRPGRRPTPGHHRAATRRLLARPAVVISAPHGPPCLPSGSNSAGRVSASQAKRDPPGPPPLLDPFRVVLTAKRCLNSAIPGGLQEVARSSREGDDRVAPVVAAPVPPTSERADVGPAASAASRRW